MNGLHHVSHLNNFIYSLCITQCDGQKKKASNRAAFAHVRTLFELYYTQRETYSGIFVCITSFDVGIQYENLAPTFIERIKYLTDRPIENCHINQHNICSFGILHQIQCNLSVITLFRKIIASSLCRNKMLSKTQTVCCYLIPNECSNFINVLHFI